MSRHCLQCGQHLVRQIIEGRPREICPACGWIYYEQLKVSAGARVEQDDCLLMAQRAIDPWKSCWCLPAGFVEVDETPEAAAVREVFEETGLKVKITGFAGFYQYFDDPRGNGLVLMFDAKVIGGGIVPCSETMQAGFYPREEVQKKDLAGLCVRKQVSDWLEIRKSAND